MGACATLPGRVGSVANVLATMGRVAAFALGVALLTVLAACNDDLPPPGQFTTFAGHVTDRATSQPIAGAVVTVDTVLTAKTDAAGNFKIDKVPAGITDYTVQADGYTLVSASVTTQPGTPFTLDVALDRPATSH